MTPDLRLGRWQDVLDGVTCDSLITDPPYSARTHEGQRSGPGHTGQGGRPCIRSAISYEAVGEDYCESFVSSWAPRVRHLWVIFGDDQTQAWWSSALRSAGMVVFAPLAWVRHPGPRLTGDGPTSGAEWVTIARTCGKWATSPPWGSLPGWYDVPTAHLSGESFRGLVGQKPVRLMRAIVRDYSRPGWTICDPHAGSGTTLVAAAEEGRHAVGSEQDAERYRIASRRCAEPVSRSLFGVTP